MCESVCWPETNRLLDFSPAEVSIFRFSAELQFGVCNHGDPCASSPKEWEEELLFLFFFFRAPTMRYGSSQARGRIETTGMETELQLQTYTTATGTLALSYTCDLCCSLWQCWILDPQSEARDWTCILMDTSQTLNLLSHNGNSEKNSFRERKH